MTIRRRVLAGVLAVPLLLAGCSSEGTDDAPAPATTTSAASSSTVEGTPETVTVGDTIKLTCYSHLPCDADLTITDVVVSDECTYGNNSYDEYAPEEGEIHLEVWGELVANSDSSEGSGSVMAPDPQIIDSEGFTESAGISAWCNGPDDGTSGWTDPVEVGEKKRLYDAYVISDDAATMKLGDYHLELPDQEPANTAPAEMSASQPAAAQTTEPSAPTVVECLEGTPGPSRMSDGTTQHTDYCFNLRGGPAYLEQESKSGYDGSPGENAPTATSFRSSGEAQSYHGCIEGYIDDPDLCSTIFEMYGDPR